MASEKRPAGPRRTTAADPAKDAARAYITHKPDAAREPLIREHKVLAEAFRAEDELRKTAAQSKPLSKSVEIKVDTNIRQSIAAAVARGTQPTPTPRTHEALRIQVAFDNSEHALGVRRLDPQSTLSITREDRSLLVRVAELEIGGNAVKGRGSELEKQQRALDIAGNIGRLDLPRTDNPFANAKLVAAYETEQSNARSAQASEQSRARGRDGASR